MELKKENSRQRENGKAESHEPDVIYLQYHGDGDPIDDGSVRDCDVTWCRDRIFDTDIKYVRAGDAP